MWTSRRYSIPFTKLNAKTLKVNSVPPNLLDANAPLYEDAKAIIITFNGETDFFNLTALILQRETLASYLFVLLVDYVMHKALNERGEDINFKLNRRRSKCPLFMRRYIEHKKCSRLENQAANVVLHCNLDKNGYQELKQNSE